jgi:hypothetical protein
MHELATRLISEIAAARAAIAASYVRLWQQPGGGPSSTPGASDGGQAEVDSKARDDADGETSSE